MLQCLEVINSIGIDEVGRGPLAGPVVAGCVFVPIDLVIPDSLPTIRDSKKMSKHSREKVVDWLYNQSHVKFALGLADVNEIDSLNILNATLLAMRRAFFALNMQCDRIFIDGNKAPDLGCANAECVIGGDNRILSIALASILAKEHRDHLMINIGKIYPQYGFEKNVGYGTKKHIDAISTYGHAECHRKSFEPVKSMIASSLIGGNISSR